MNPSIQVIWPDGSESTVYLLRLLVQVQDAEMMAKHGMHLPGIAKQHPTVKRIREEYHIPRSAARTWRELAPLLRRFHTDLTTERELRLDEERIDAEMTEAEVRGITAPEF